ncbi:hypothetical protein K438DRAFT_1766214 [Mycena galopus ATCC 62051]|nr:hypothetical protein K438DRAFT_1766214 [Mycena galopus ATCC 62051]
MGGKNPNEEGMGTGRGAASNQTSEVEGDAREEPECYVAKCNESALNEDFCRTRQQSSAFKLLLGHGTRVRAGVLRGIFQKDQPPSSSRRSTIMSQYAVCRCAHEEEVPGAPGPNIPEHLRDSYALPHRPKLNLDTLGRPLVLPSGMEKYTPLDPIPISPPELERTIFGISVGPKG